MSDIKYHGLPTEKLYNLIDALCAERDQLKADLGNACEENRNIVDSLLKDIGMLKAERDQLLKAVKEGDFGCCEYAKGVLQSQLTTAKEALRNINELCVKVQMQSTQRLYQEAPFVVQKVKDVVTEALTKLENKS